MSWPKRVQEVADARTAANKPVWDLIDGLNKDENLSSAEKQEYLSALYGSLSDKDVTQALVSEAAAYQVGTSFRSSINDLRRVKSRMRKRGLNIFPGGNLKLNDRAFAAALGIPVPNTFAEDVPLAEIELISDSVLKPMRGSSSRGVFYVDSSLRLHSIKTSKTYASVHEARTEISEYKDRISANRWLLEEAILTSEDRPANDLKVYAFYGVAGMFLEIDRHFQSGPKYATYDHVGHEIELGPAYQSFSGSGIPGGVRAMVEKLSLAAPVPFLRLDFHHGKKGTYLGEITPHPGGTYSGELFESVDKMLGHHFSEAKARLYADLLNGKVFPEFRLSYGVH